MGTLGRRSEVSLATDGGRPDDEPEDGGEPWPGYDDMTIREVVERLGVESGDAARSVGLYEREHKARKGVLSAVARRLGSGRR